MLNVKGHQQKLRKMLICFNISFFIPPKIWFLVLMLFKANPKLGLMRNRGKTVSERNSEEWVLVLVLPNILIMLLYIKLLPWNSLSNVTCLTLLKFITHLLSCIPMSSPTISSAAHPVLSQAKHTLSYLWEEGKEMTEIYLCPSSEKTVEQKDPFRKGRKLCIQIPSQGLWLSQTAHHAMPKREREGGREERKQINKEKKKGLSPINSRYMNASSPGYGTLPFVTSSVCRIPNDHTSDLIVNRPYSAASGAVHLIGNFAPKTVLTSLLQ